MLLLYVLSILMYSHVGKGVFYTISSTKRSASGVSCKNISTPSFLDTSRLNVLLCHKTKQTGTELRKNRMHSHPGVESPNCRAVKCAGFLLAVWHVHFEDHDLRTVRAPRPSPHAHIAVETFAPQNEMRKRKE